MSPDTLETTGTKIHVIGIKSDQPFRILLLTILTLSPFNLLASVIKALNVCFKLGSPPSGTTPKSVTATLVVFTCAIGFPFVVFIPLKLQSILDVVQPDIINTAHSPSKTKIIFFTSSP